MRYPLCAQGGSFSDDVHTGNELSANDVVNTWMGGYYTTNKIGNMTHCEY